MRKTQVTIADGSVVSVGERVQAHPATDAWMMGDRYGEITKVGRRLVHVKMDKSEKTRYFSPSLLISIPGGEY